MWALIKIIERLFTFYIHLINIIMKKQIISHAIVLFILHTIFIFSCSKNTETFQIEKQSNRPAWLDDIPLILVGGWDSEPATQRRWNYAAIDIIDAYEERMSEETVINLKEKGITLVINHYFKGYGIEGEYMESSRKFAELCHKHGIRVGVYISNTINHEKILSEEPRAQEWLVPDYSGQPVTYGRQTFRSIPYIGHPGYQKYIKKVLKKAIIEAKVDLIHFDNSCMYALPQFFHHPLAVEQFRDFLKNKYTADQLKNRFDLNNVMHIIPPKHTDFQGPLQDPLFQEWTDFRCHKTGEYLMEMRRYIKELNPNVVVESNPHGVTGLNTAWIRGIDWPRVLSPTEVFWNEGQNDPGVKANGALDNRIRTYKVGRIMNNLCFVRTAHDKLMMAEAMAYNQNCFGYVGDILGPKSWSEEVTRYINFFQHHFEYYKHTENIAPVAILRTFPTMAYSPYDTQYSTILFEQALIQNRIPFNIIFDLHLEKNLSEYKVLVLSDQDCMSDEQIQQIQAYVKAGGGLIITGNTSLYNEWRRRRHRLGLRDLFHEDLPYPPGAKMTRDQSTGIAFELYSHSSLTRELTGFTEKKIAEVRGQYGNGRVVYIPHVIPGLNKPSDTPPTGQYWKLPKNHQELVDAIRWASGEPFPIEIKAPLHVTMEWLWQRDKDRMLIHLVNYDTKNFPTVNNISVEMKIPDEKHIKEIIIFSPDVEVNFKGDKLFFHIINGWLKFSVPRLHMYNLVAILYE